MLEALRLQSTSCASLGSRLYADLLDGLAGDYERRGITWRLLADRPERALHDAVPLRLLGALHRIVLRGGAPALAERYPSAGGDGQPVALADVVAVLEAHAGEISAELNSPVQTNEVARCALLVVGFTALARETTLPLRLLEVGASAGLNLNWDRYWYDTGATHVGTAGSEVRFDATTQPAAWADPVDLSGEAGVSSARGCDASPLDATDPDDRRRLLSFVWPDQLHRFARLQAALAIATEHPPVVDRADAGAWVARALDVPASGRCTIVYHSIVWQYLGDDSRAMLRAALQQAGALATADRPLAWLRMEPAGRVTDLRVTTWPGGQERTLAHAGYHGQAVHAGPPP